MIKNIVTVIASELQLFIFEVSGTAVDCKNTGIFVRNNSLVIGHRGILAVFDPRENIASLFTLDESK